MIDTTPQDRGNLMKTVTFTCSVPPGVNELYANRKSSPGKSRQFGRMLTKKHAAWRKEVGQLLMIQRARPIKGRVDIDVYIDEASTNDRIDIDGRTKAPIDALVAFGIIQDDSKPFVRRTQSQWDNVPEGCRIVITLVETI
jgi:Holliday junction resolvase RusA-like endonuclease